MMVMVLAPLVPPTITVRLLGEAARLKLGALIVREMAAVLD